MHVHSHFHVLHPLATVVQATLLFAQLAAGAPGPLEAGSNSNVGSSSFATDALRALNNTMYQLPAAQEEFADSGPGLPVLLQVFEVR